MTDKLKEKKVIAFFDVDHTLVDGSTGGILVHWLYNHGYVRRRKFLGVLWLGILYSFNRLSALEAYRWGLKISSGVPLDELFNVFNKAFEDWIAPRIYKEGIELIQAHKKNGHICVLITGAPEYLAERVRLAVGGDVLIATKTPVEKGFISATIPDDYELCFKDGKVKMAREFADEIGADLKDCFFYSDSASDLPLLSAVGHPVVVNPRRNILKEAKKKMWPMIRFYEHITISPQLLPRPTVFAGMLISDLIKTLERFKKEPAPL